MSGRVGVRLRKAVTDGLRSHLSALPDFNGTGRGEDEVEVSYSFEFDSLVAQQVYTGRSRAETPPAAMRAGNNHKDETGTFDLNIRVRYIGGDGYEADDRAEQIADAVEAWIDARKSGEGLGITGLSHLYVSGWDSDYAGIDSGVASLITLRVSWRAYRTPAE